MANSPSNEGKLVLYRGFPPSNKYTWSPFVSKLEFRLRYSHVPYVLEAGSTQVAPRSKIPYADIGPLTKANTSEMIGDSTLIINTLVERRLAEDLNAHLSPEQKLADAGVTALIEDKLYFVDMAEGWIGPDAYYIMRDHILASQPWPLRVVIGNLIYRSVTSTLYGQGTLRFTREEQRKMQEEIWKTLEDLLAQRRKEAGDRKGPFWALGGEKPTEADAILFGRVNSLLVCENRPESIRLVRNCKSVMDYAGRIHDAYFADFEKWEL